MYKCTRKLHQLRHDLFIWCKEYQAANSIIWDEAVDKCAKIQNNLGCDGSMMQEKQVREELFEHALLKLAYWKQREKEKWSAIGDSNTSYFFRCAKSRKSRNEIRIIKDEDGNWSSDPK